MSTFDQCARYAAREVDPEGFLRWLLPAEVFGAWRWAGWLDTRRVAFPGEPERHCDTVAVFERLAGDAPPVAAVIEFQTEPRGDMPERLGEYLLRLRREVPAQREPRVPYQSVAILVNLTGPVQPGEWAMAPADYGGLGLWTRGRVLTLREVDAAALLADVASGRAARAVLPWMPLMAGADAPERLAEWRRLAGQEPDSRRRSDLGALAVVSAELAGRAAFWRTELEGWNMKESQTVLEWIAEGKELGRSEGAAVLRDKILRFLQRIFSGQLPADLVAAINAQSDLDTLSDWCDRALAATSLDEVRAAILKS
jgi:hypothetical protein